MPAGIIERFKTGLWRDNPGLVQLLGLCPLLAVTATFVNGLGLGLAAVAGVGAGVAVLWAATGVYLGRQFNTMNSAQSPVNSSAELNN